jgi:hypothetical protein
LSKTSVRLNVALIVHLSLCSDTHPRCAVDQLLVLFSQDAGFSRSRFDQQMAVLRGQVSTSLSTVSGMTRAHPCRRTQIVNLRQALKERRTPAQLTQMPTVTVVVHHEHGAAAAAAAAASRSNRSYRQIITSRLPFFKWC